MVAPAGYAGPELLVLSRNIKQEEVAVFVTRVMAEVPQTVQKVAVFNKDKVDGELTQKVLDGFNERNAQMAEMSDFMQDVQKVKLDVEQKNMRMAAELTEWTFKRIVSEIEDIIEEDKKVKHSYI
jgi:Xaa-Pro aminopeptidase